MDLAMRHLQQANHEDCAQCNFLPCVHIQAEDNRNWHSKYEDVTNARQDTTCESNGDEWVGDTTATLNCLIPEVLYRLAFKECRKGYADSPQQGVDPDSPSSNANASSGEDANIK